jgi:hypothetical protein
MSLGLPFRRPELVYELVQVALGEVRRRLEQVGV